MGAYSPLPWLLERFGGEDAFVDEVTRTIAEPVVRQLDAGGTPFIGLLYAGLILTDDGVKVIEFNARFGDPETQVVLPRLVDPLSELLLAAASGTLEDHAKPAFAEAVAVTVVVASEGYPEQPITGRPIEGLDAAASLPGVHIAHAATAERDGALVATGGRVLNVVALGTTFAEASRRAYQATDHIRLEGSQHRTDIATRVVERRTE
jgi:phosphoribosylamine--glycine ligase